MRHIRLRRAAATVVLAAALLPALVTVAAAADGWRELPARDVPGAGIAACLRDAGDGRLALLGAFDGERTDSELLAVGDGGLAPVATTRLPALSFCPEVGAVEGGTPLLAGTAFVRGRGRGETVRVSRVVADAGGDARVLSRARLSDLGLARGAVAPSGAAVVTWSERAPDGRGGKRIVALTRPSAGAPFGAPQQLGNGSEEPVAGIDAAGRAHVAWVARDRLHVRSAARGGKFTTTLRSAPLDLPGAVTALAVAADGRALVAVADRDAAAIWELPPGGGAFERLALPQVPGERFALALQPGGSAVVAGFTPGDDHEVNVVVGDPDADAGGIALARRAGTGAFGGLQRLPVERRPAASGIVSFADDDTAPPGEWRGNEVSLALSPAGALAVAWSVDAAQGLPAAVFAARGTLADGVGAPRRLGSPCRSTGDPVAFLRADGRVAVAWTDHGSGDVLADAERGAGGGRLHVAVPEDGTATGDAGQTAPRATVEPLARTLAPSTDLPLRLRCAEGPCAVRVRATVRPNASSPFVVRRPLGVSTATSLAAGEVRDTTLQTIVGWSFVRPGSAAPVRLETTVCTPDGSAFRTATAAARLRTRALPPAPRIVGLRARRDGRRAVVVSWRLTRPLPARTTVAVDLTAVRGRAPDTSTAIRHRGLRYHARVTVRGRAVRPRAVRVMLVGELVPVLAQASTGVSGR